MIEEGWASEASSISTGREIASEYLNPDDHEDKHYIAMFETMGTHQIIIFSYGFYELTEIVMPEKLAIQYIADWCYWHLGNEVAGRLVRALKDKYGVDD